MSILNKKLTQKEQEKILSHLFGLYFEDDVLYIEGAEFYGFNDNLKYDFTTLKGILEYTKDQHKNEGVRSAQLQFRNAIGL